jgi:hypothetical protein
MEKTFRYVNGDLPRGNCGGSILLHQILTQIPASNLHTYIVVNTVELTLNIPIKLTIALLYRGQNPY